MESRSPDDQDGAMPLSVVAPAHNEENLLGPAVTRIVEGLRGRQERFEVLVCENGSSDRTVEIASGLERDLPEVRVLQLPDANYGLALRTGFLAAAGDLVANFDVDFIDLGFLERAVAMMAADPGIAVVVGTKRGEGADDRRTIGRRLVTSGFSLVMRVGFGLRASDTHGLKVMRRRVVAPLVEGCVAAPDIFDTELILRAERAGLAVAEVPVTVVEQRPARTSISSRIPRTLAGLLRLRLALWRERGGAAP